MNKIEKEYKNYVNKTKRPTKKGFLKYAKISEHTFDKAFIYAELKDKYLKGELPATKSEIFDAAYKEYLKDINASVHSIFMGLGWRKGLAYDTINKLFKSTKHLLAMLQAQAEKDGHFQPTRNELDNRKKMYVKNKSRVKKYVVTAAMPEAELHKQAWQSIQNYAERNKAEIVVLPMRGMNHSHKRYTQELYNSTKNHFAIEYQLSKNLIARDVKLFPAHRNPAYANRDLAMTQSLIMAHTKQDQAPCHVLDSTKPRSVFTTGTITTREFNNTLSGYRNAQEMKIGAVIVDVDNNTNEFYARHATFQDDYISDMGTKYHSDNTISEDKAICLKMGDVHSLFTEPQYKQASIEQINHFQVPEAVAGDWFDGKSISHYEAGNLVERSKLLSLEEELNYLVDDVRSWLDKTNAKIGMTASNHPEWINRYLLGSRYINDPLNYRIGIKLTAALIDKKDPIEYYFKENAPELCNRINFYKRHEIERRAGWLYTIHGDLGPDGARGSIHNQSASGPAIIEHIHGAGKRGDVMSVGTLALQTLEYAANRLSSWQAQNIIIFESGAAQQLWMSPKGKWRIN